jgi:hypothetical protein
MPSRYRQRVDANPTTGAVRQALERLARDSRGRFVSLTNPSWLDDRLFSDPLHLGSEGARRFAQELAAEVDRPLE